MRIAILGTRGIPASYGGFETFAEELSRRLVDRGHHVSVYGRARELSDWFSEKYYGRVLTRLIPTIYHKYFETIVHTLLSFIDCSRADADVILLCNAANSPFIPIARLRGIPVVVNVDGVERKRSKWNLLGKTWYRLGELSSVLFANRVVADAEVIADYYLKTYGVESSVIAYGAERLAQPVGFMHQQFDLVAGNYLLYVSRLEPENNALGVIEAYVQSGVSIPLVVVGDAPYAEAYKNQLKAAALGVKGDSRVVFTGFQFGSAYRELREHCLIYIQATEVGGTHPALVEAMVHGNCIIANDVPEHREVLGECGLYYERNNFPELAQTIIKQLHDPKGIQLLSFAAEQRAQVNFSWDIITNKYEELLRGLARGD